MKFLIDTCVLSEMMKINPNPNVVKWINKYPQEDLFLSVLTLGEIKKGIRKLEQGPKKKILNEWLENDIVNKFNKNILPIDKNIALRWGELQAKVEKEGIKQPILDSLIATTALEYDLTIATRNIKDFINSGCKLYNPWE